MKVVKKERERKNIFANLGPFSVELLLLNQNKGSSDNLFEKYKFTGHERDQNTNYDYMHFRFYASSMGRFLKPDNIIPDAFNPQSWNLYTYVNGNPANFNDPFGHQAVGLLEEGQSEGKLPSPVGASHFFDEGKGGGGGGKPKDKPPLTIVLKADALTPDELTTTKEAITKELSRIGIDPKVVTTKELSPLKSLGLRIKAALGGNVSFVDIDKGFSSLGKNVLGTQAGIGELANTVFLGPATKAGLKGEALGNYVANISLHEVWHDITRISDAIIVKPADWNPQPGTIMAYPKNVKELGEPQHFSSQDVELLLKSLMTKRKEM